MSTKPMDEYEVVFARAARKELESLDAKLVERIFERIVSLAREPRPTSSRCLPMIRPHVRGSRRAIPDTLTCAESISRSA